jgi:hypothetical protein
VLSVGEERDGFTGIFEVAAADKARVGRMKRRPFCAGNVDCRPFQPFATLAARSTLASLPDPGGELGQGTLPRPFARPTDDPTDDDAARRSRSRRGCYGRGYKQNPSMEGVPGAASSTTVAADAARVAWARDRDAAQIGPLTLLAHRNPATDTMVEHRSWPLRPLGR